MASFAKNDDATFNFDAKFGSLSRAPMLDEGGGIIDGDALGGGICGCEKLGDDAKSSAAVAPGGGGCGPEGGGRRAPPPLRIDEARALNFGVSDGPAPPADASR